MYYNSIYIKTFETIKPKQTYIFCTNKHPYIAVRIYQLLGPRIFVVEQSDILPLEHPHKPVLESACKIVLELALESSYILSGEYFDKHFSVSIDIADVGF